MNTAPKLPEGLEPVAWLDDGLSASNGTEDSSFRVVTDKTKRNMPHAAVVSYITPLVRLSDAQAALQAQAAEIAKLREALTSVKNAGAPLANFAFNLAQHPGRSLNQRECGLIDLCRKDWDAAIDAARVLAAKEAKQ